MFYTIMIVQLMIISANIWIIAELAGALDNQKLEAKRLMHEYQLIRAEGEQ